MTSQDRPSTIRSPFPVPPEPGVPLEVADGVLWFRFPLPMALDHVNIFALDDGTGWTVIDTALDTRKTCAIWQTVMSGPLSGRPVTRVILTHHHPDHTGLAGWFRSEFGSEIFATRTAWLMARMLQLDEQAVPSAETVAFWKSAGMAPNILQQRMGERPFNFADMLAPIPLGFTGLAAGDRITMGGRDWTVRLGGGHAPDHATFWSVDGTLVLGGDQLLPSISPNIGLYATEPEADPLRDWLESCGRFSAVATEDQLVLPGHKLPYYGLPTRLRQLAQNHTSALDRLEEYLATPHTAAECFQTLFLREIGGGEYGLALAEAMAHVVHLWHAGRATRSLRDDGAWLWHCEGPR